MEKTIYNTLISELSVLYEISSISSQATEEEFCKDIMERAIRIFSLHYFAILSDKRVIISYGFRNLKDIPMRIKQNKPNQIQFIFKAPEEQIILFMEQANPIGDRERRIYNIFAHRIEKALLSIKNLIARKVAEKKLIDAEKLSAVGQIAAEAAHELKNPLAVIKTGLHYLNEIIPKDKKDAQKIIHLLNDALERATSYINNLLSFSRPSSLELKPVEIKEVIEACLEELPAEVLVGIEIKKDFEPNLPQIMADSEKLKQAFTNIIKNAKESMGQEGRLIIEGKLCKDKLQIVFSDTGKGIPEENLSRIFDPFFTTKGKGTGLGLAICQRIIEAHKGEIEVRSELGKGTTFIIRMKV